MREIVNPKLVEIIDKFQINYSSDLNDDYLDQMFFDFVSDIIKAVHSEQLLVPNEILIQPHRDLKNNFLVSTKSNRASIRIEPQSSNSFVLIVKKS